MTKAIMSFDGYDFGVGHFYVYVIRSKLDVGPWQSEQAIYVGVTNNPAERWGAHIALAVQGKDRSRGMSPLVTQAFQRFGAASFKFDVLHVFKSKSEALVCELEEIEQLGTGEHLGGCNSVGPWCDGARTHSMSVREKISEAGRKRYLDPEFRQRHLVRSTIANRDPERIAKVSESMRRVLSDPKMKEKYAASRRAYFASEGAKQRQSKVVKEAKADPEKRKVYSAKAFKSWSDPVVRARRMRLSADKHLARALARGKMDLVKQWQEKIDEMDRNSIGAS